ncbi:putative bicyclomycin resistance protein [Microthyrium microscopicum]|uniref:Putative bicyclomycin resistance protein n=1 Tax=Microthyrium microscopicum TaxID=703497 RepID=A0A6A6U018_9PEZI|nr:putative bicyclomycin resistance protein [Microthyrium microscopicum]
MDPEKDKEFGQELQASDPHLAIELDLERSSSDEETHQNDIEASRVGSRTVTRVVTAQDWTGPDDPENPHNWFIGKRIWHTIQPGLFGLAVTFGSSAFSPAVEDVAKSFHVSQTAATLGITLYVLGLGFGPVLAAPMSETYGRRIVYWISLPISMLFTLGAGFSTNFGSLLVCRFFAGLFGSPVLGVGAGTNADLFPPRSRANATISFLLAPFLGTSLGPLVNGFAVQAKGWKWSQWTILMLSLGIYISSLTMDETYKKTILQKRSKRLGIAPPKSILPPGFAGVKMILTITLFRPMRMLLFEPIVLFLSLYSAFTFGVLFAFLDAFPVVFVGVYHFNLGQLGLSFLSLAIGYILAVPTSVAVDFFVYQKKHRAAAAKGQHLLPPEERLYTAMMGSFGVTIGLFWFGWTSRESIHWIVPMIGVVPFAWGNLCIFSASALYVIDVYGPLNGASAMGANSLARYALGAAFPLFTTQMYNKLGIGWASSLLGFLSLVMIPIPFVLFKWGPQIRAKSSFETVKF